MRIPVLAGVVERRVLLNYAVDPEVVARLLPPPLEPVLAGGSAVAGVCLIRLGRLRPAGLPGAVGIRTENAAHRIAVRHGDRTGVFIPRRHSASRPTVWLGGRLFPGVHGHARFTVREDGDDLRVAFACATGSVDVALTVTDDWPGSALFGGLAEASEFFRAGSAGWSATRDRHRLDGLELRTEDWSVRAAVVRRAESTFFADPALFPPGSARLDGALVMRDLPVSWHSLPSLAVDRPAQLV
ncbi:MAG: hypothetical protein AVDCRST_MAG41-515 [uncultured Corynebacteriales bacterium]|uniref:Uncharacterized protein n=1 Tax=uncultured Mycobacteriales bacterium TaxID=581187 RepID=A0A6J4HH94_9ACTN|nr:MAG: hypothetical protein AVDCRST_MAG41-515 [uncultured Corynebacteriales bacterium]